MGRHRAIAAVAVIVVLAVAGAGAAWATLRDTPDTVYACARPNGRVTNLRWDRPPRCNRGDVIEWAVTGLGGGGTTTTTTAPTTSTVPSNIILEPGVVYRVPEDRPPGRYERPLLAGECATQTYDQTGSGQTLRWEAGDLMTFDVFDRQFIRVLEGCPSDWLYIEPTTTTTTMPTTTTTDPSTTSTADTTTTTRPTTTTTTSTTTTTASTTMTTTTTIAP